jgi:hypothetical protein
LKVDGDRTFELFCLVYETRFVIFCWLTLWRRGAGGGFFSKGAGGGLLRFLDSKTNRKLYLFKNINVNE